MVHVRRHIPALTKLGLDSTAGVLALQGDQIKDHGGKRDVISIAIEGDAGPVLLFVKRMYRSKLGDGVWSVLRHGRVRSVAHEEWQNYVKLEARGIGTATSVAFGEDVGLLKEQFSFIITEAAQGLALDDYLRDNPPADERARVITALGRWTRGIHDSGIALPDLFARHIFVNATSGSVRFSLIDIARIDEAATIAPRLRARDLAALWSSVLTVGLTPREIVRFFKSYSPQPNRPLRVLIARRLKHIFRRPNMQAALQQSLLAASNRAETTNV